MENLLKELAEIIAPIAECEVSEVLPDSDLPNDLEIDSLRGLEILVMIDRKFKVKLAEDQIHEMSTPRKIAEMISKKLELADTVS